MNRDAILSSIDDRLAELDAMATEAEREALLTELEAGRPVTPARVDAVAAVDLERAETMPEAAYTRTCRAAIAELLARAGIVDAVPLTLKADTLGGGLVSVSVVSAAAGRVTLGTLDLAILAQAERAELLGAREGLVEPSRGGIERPQIVSAVVDGALLTDSGWELPTQAATAEALGLADGRRIRQVQGSRGWAGIQADALARLAERQRD